MKLIDWAEKEGVSAYTARRWIREGTFPVPYTVSEGGHYFIHDPKYDAPEIATGGRVVGYARVSSRDQKDDLMRQRDRVSAYIANMGENAPEVVTEVGSGMNGKRPKLNKLLSDPTVGTIVVEHSDRLARINVPLVDSALRAVGRRLIIIDDSETETDLVQDIIDFMTSACARLYGKRGARNRAEKALGAARDYRVES